MRNVLFIGQKPGTVDTSESSMLIWASSNLEKESQEGGTTTTDDVWGEVQFFITPDDCGIRVVNEQLTKRKFEIIVIGGGLRVYPEGSQFVDQLVSAIRHGAPGASVLINVRRKEQVSVPSQDGFADTHPHIVLIHATLATGNGNASRR